MRRRGIADGLGVARVGLLRLPRFLLCLANGVAVVSPLLWLSAIACGDHKGSGGAGGGANDTGGAGTSSGTANVAGGAGVNHGGTSGVSGGNQGGESHGGSSVGTGGSSAGGSLSAAGTSGSSPGGAGGSMPVEPGEPCTASCPTGTVQTCFDACPFGACDNGHFFADEACSTIYPSPLSAQTVYCAKDQTGSYCLTVIDKSEYFYVVECDAGTPVVTACNGGCGVRNDTHAASCNE